MNLKQRLKDRFPNLKDDDFAIHYSDLYVVHSKDVSDWLRTNYEFYSNITFFTSQIGSNWNGAGKICLDIPFAAN